MALRQPSGANFPFYATKGFYYCNHFSTNCHDGEFSGTSAYDVLGVSETSSFAEIKASFRKLAKETHPDTAQSCSTDPAAATNRFIQILAAYEILSDSERRAHYDYHLYCRRKHLQRLPGLPAVMYRNQSCVAAARQMEVVEWLKWYRLAINDIVLHKKVVMGSSYLDRLERGFYSAINGAYYGPIIESLDLLPSCFEAEERSATDIPELLHLVSGRHWFGTVFVVDMVPQLSELPVNKLTTFSTKNDNLVISTLAEGENEELKKQGGHGKSYMPDAYKDVMLHIAGKEVAFAVRIPPKSCCNGFQNKDSLDHIHVFLSLEQDRVQPTSSLSAGQTRILLGTITGLGTHPEDEPCYVYDNCGAKTHVIMKHRTLMVKHMHWYQVGDRVSPCECRCSRAWLPPSKFWLFEPRSEMHDIGGWYVETFGRDKKGRTVLSQREWNGCCGTESQEKRLHPALYLLTLAYRTLDLEDARRRKETVRNILEPKLFSIFKWGKRFF